MTADTLLWRPRARMLTYLPDRVAQIAKRLGHQPTGADLRRLEREEGLRPDEIGEWVDGNLVVTTGLARIAGLITGAGAAFTNARGFLGVGSSSTAAAAGNTALGGNGSASTAWYRGLDAGNPTVSGGIITANCTFTGADASFDWNEWCWGITDSGAITPAHTLTSVGTGAMMLNRKVAALGSKAGGSTSTLNSQIQLSSS